MAITLADFNKIWASTSPLTPYSFSDSQYKEGWNFVGGTPPSRQMWDFLQKNNDEKMQYLANNYLPLSGGTMTGDIKSSGTYFAISNVKSDYSGQLNLFSADGKDNGAYLTLNAKAQANYAGSFLLHTGDGTNAPTLMGKPDGTLTWNSNAILTANNYNSYALPLSGGTLTGAINTANKTWNKLGDDASFGDYNIGGKMCIKSQTARKTGIAFFNETDTNVGEVEVNNAFDFNKPVKENGGFLVPIGIVQAFAGSTTPQGWLLCDGSAVSRTDYAALFSVIGTTYGAGDGSTTFNLPNLTDRFIQGNSTVGTVKNAGLPNITGRLSKNGDLLGYFESFDGAFYADSQSNRHAVQQSTNTYYLASGGNFDASRCSSIYGNSNTVQPPALTMRYIIKY